MGKDYIFRFLLLFVCSLGGGGFPSLPCLCETKALLWVEHPDVIWDTGTATDSLSSGLPLGIHK